MKKAAMFGLDARIALAIFGALSVISGAALYSAIQQAKVISIAADIDEFAKAHDAYYIDVGSLMSLNPSSPNNLRPITEELLYSTKTGWKGPYTSIKDIHTVDDGYLSYSKYGMYTIHYFYAKDTTWGDSTSAGTPQICDDSNPCYLWVVLHEVEPTLAEQIDIFYDQTKDFDAGDVRVFTGDTNTNGKYDVLAVKKSIVIR